MLGERMKLLREEMGLSQEEFASRAQSRQNQVWRWESGEQVPSSDKLALIAQVLETTTDYLVGLSNNPYPKLIEEDLTKEEQLLIIEIRRKNAAQALQIMASLTKNPD